MFKRKRDSDGASAWAAALRGALGDGHDDIVEWIRSGRAQPVPPLDPSTHPIMANRPLTPAQLQQFADQFRFAEWSGAVRRARWDWLTLTEHMESGQRDRLAQLMGRNPPAQQFLWSALVEPGMLLAAVDPVAGTSLYDVERAGAWLGYDAAAMIEMIYSGFHGRPWQRDFEEWTRAHMDAVVAVVAPLLHAQRINWTRITWGGRDLVLRFRVELVADATSSAKTTRAATRDALAVVRFEDIETELKRTATDAKPASRASAIDVMAQMVGDDRRDELVRWVVEHCGSDRSAAVQEAIDRFAGSSADEPVEAAELPAIDMDVPVPDGFTDRLLDAMTEGKPSNQWERTQVKEVGEALRGNLVTDERARRASFYPLMPLDRETLRTLHPVHVARVLLVSGSSLHWQLSGAVEIVRVVGGPTPMEMQAVAAAHGLDPSTAHGVVTLLLGADPGPGWTHDDIASWTLRELPALIRYVDDATDQYRFGRAGLFAAFATLETRPERLTTALVRTGLTGLKADQQLARRVLGTAARDLVVAALGASKGGERLAAAAWLRELKDPSTEASLRAAIDREQQDVVKAQMLQALEAVGASLDEYLAPERLTSDAANALAKKNAVPASMEWLRFDHLPVVHWRDGAVVDPAILRWYAASSVKAKSVEASPLLRRHASSMREDEVRRFAEAVFDAWVSRDLQPRPREECERDAMASAAWKIKWANQDPKGEAYPQYRNLTPEQGMLLDLPRALAQPAGSATDCKGLLSLVAAMGGPELAPRVLAYLKQWRGTRVHQGKAMLQMLSWIDHPAAIQVLLTVAQRFRPTSLQEEAAAQARALADRRGWTVDDLADRTVPRGGFDDDGRMRLDYGDRSFTAHLRDDLTIELIADATGKVIKALPAPRQDEDAAEVKGLQQDLAAAKKEVKSTAKLQPERLFVSMCTERTWEADDFMRYVVHHPVMRRLACRLVWIADRGGERQLFRPLSDGTLIDIDDGDVDLTDDTTVLVAHDAHVAPDVGARWVEHLADYAVTPLFPQFARPIPPSTDGNMIDDVKGHMINALTLRGALNKYAWQLGEAQDGGMVCWVQKDFGSAGLTAVLEITGTPAYAEDHTAAFLSAYFTKRGGVGMHSRAVPLADVPPILLRETYAEILAIAGAGTGYSADYEKQVTYG